MENRAKAGTRCEAVAAAGTPQCVHESSYVAVAHAVPVTSAKKEFCKWRLEASAHACCRSQRPGRTEGRAQLSSPQGE